MKKYLDEIELQIGSQFWSVTNQTLRKVLDFHERNPQYSSYFKRVKLSDETFFQTLIILFSTQVNGSGIMYANWEIPNSPHPSPLSKDLLAVQFNSDKFYFARKFCSEESELLRNWRYLFDLKLND